MKKIALALIALVMSTGAFAQDFGQFNPADMAKMQVDHIKEVCKTDDAQTAKLLDFFVAQGKEMAKTFEKGFDMAAFQKSQEKQDTFVKSVLTKDQYKKYEEDQRKMREMFAGGGAF